jgi:hypothetical protein
MEFLATCARMLRWPGKFSRDGHTLSRLPGKGCIRHILRMPIDPIMGRNPKTQLHYKSDTFLLPLPVVRAKVLSILPSMRRGQVKKISPERQTP